jgi:hypothetical protein
MAIAAVTVVGPVRTAVIYGRRLAHERDRGGGRGDGNDRPAQVHGQSIKLEVTPFPAIGMTSGKGRW